MTTTQEEVVASLKRLLSERVRVPVARIQALELETPLLKDGLGLDSLDCVELLLGMQEEFGLVFDDGEEDWMYHFSCLSTLSQLVLLAGGAVDATESTVEGRNQTHAGERSKRNSGSLKTIDVGGSNDVGEGIVSEVATMSSKHQDQHDSLISSKSEELPLVGSRSVLETLETYDFNDPPFGGTPPELIEKELGVKVEILGKRDEWLEAYPIRISGAPSSISAFLKKYRPHRKQQPNGVIVGD